MHNQISHQQVFRFHNQVIRDLAWSIWGPALLIHTAPYSELMSSEFSNNEKIPDDRSFPLDIGWLQKLDQNPEVLWVYLQHKNTRLLGTYFEALWQFYFSHHPEFQFCLCNLQVNDSTRTVGEYDVLVTHNNKQNFHIELTCKFYLEWQDNRQEILWIGPNCGDRLDIKYDKTDVHQLPLLKTETGEMACIEHSFNTVNVKQIAMWRGASFRTSEWFRVNEWKDDSVLSEWKTDVRILWFIADKSLWLSPVTQARDQLKTLPQINLQIHEHFDHSATQNTHYTLMLIALTFNKTERQWQQQQRFFITPNNWPYGKLADSALMPLRPCKPPL
ncbi:MAG: hypothetical protein ACI9EX_001324 [Oleispira sp.]|jgi:hypothetical protein